MRVRLALLAVVLCLTGGLPAGGARASARPAVPSALADRVHALTAAAEAADALAVVLSGRRAAAAQGTEAGEVLAPVGDLDGDDLPDFVGVTAVDPGSGGVVEQDSVARGRRGIDGEALWESPIDAIAGVALPLRVSESPDADAVLVIGAVIDPTAGGFDLVLVVLDKAGNELWRERLEGTFPGAAGSGESSVPVDLNVLSGAPDAVVTTTLVSTAAAGRIVEEHVEVRVLAAADGTERSRVTLAEAGELGVPVPAHDFDADGLQDFVVVGDPEADEARGERVATAFSAADGSALWRTQLPDDAGRGAVPVGDVDDDGLSDVVVADGRFNDAVPALLLSGRDGQVLWQRPAATALDVGDVDADGDADVGLVTTALREGRLDVSYAAVDARGAEVASGATALPVVDGAVTGPYFAAIPDVDRDDAAEIAIVAQTGPDLLVSGVIDGAGGGARWLAVRSVGGDEILTGAVPFDDALAFTAGVNGAAGVVARDVATGELRWSAVQARGETSLALPVDAVDVDDDGQEEVVVLAQRFDAASSTALACAAVLDGETGQRRWGVGAGCAVPTPPDVVQRHAGQGRASTAVEVSRAAFARARTAVLVRDDAYADALPAGPLALAVGGPLLFTSPSALPQVTAEELARLGVTRVVLLGGEAAISSEVVADLTAQGIRTQRISGPNRFATAALVADAIGSPSRRAFVVQGSDPDPTRGWPDALAVAPWAAATAVPLLLTARDALPPETADALARRRVTAATVVGGQGAVSEEVVADLRARGHDPRRIAGPDRYATAVAVREASLAAGAESLRLWLGTGRDWPDALTAGAAVAARGETFALVDGRDLAGSAATADLLSDHRGEWTSIRLLGGEAAISAGVEYQIRVVASQD